MSEFDSGEGRPAGLTPGEAFSLLGNETRVAILQTLWEADHPLAYSDLKRDVGMREPGQFNYHLDKLVGVFVSREQDRYVLRETGNWLIRELLGGTITEDSSFGAEPGRPWPAVC